MIAPLRFLAAAGRGVDAFLCPGHVAVVVGAAAFEPLAAEFQKPFVVAGFEPGDILRGLCEILDQLEAGRPAAANLYERAVTREGNRLAAAAVDRFFEPCGALWRGIGAIPGSGLRLRAEYARYDAWPGALPQRERDSDCRCGDVMLGRIDPPECALFGRACSPASPVGPCMVSAEGACGIWLREAGA